MSANGDFHGVMPQPSEVTGPTVVAGISLGYAQPEPETEKPLVAVAPEPARVPTPVTPSRPSVTPVDPFAQELARISAEKGGKERPVCFSLTMGDRTRPKLLQSLPGHVKVLPIALTTAELLRKQCALIQSQLDAEAMAIEAHGGPTVLKDLEIPFEPSELALIREAFYDLDLNGTGRVDRESFEDVLRAARRREEEISGTNELVRNADADGDGSLDWVEFLMLANRALKTSSAGDNAESGKQSASKFVPSFGEFDFATSYSARLLSIFRLKPKNTVVPLMAGADEAEAAQGAASSAIDAAAATQTGSRDWWRAIDAVVEELAYPPPLADVLPAEDAAAAAAAEDGGASYGDDAANNAEKKVAGDFPALDEHDPRNLDLQRAQRHLTVASEHRVGRLMLRALITQLRDAGTKTNPMSPRRGGGDEAEAEQETLPSAVMTALLKVEQISAPKGAQMPLFDHEGVEYGELSDSGPPRLSAAYKFHGGREAVKQAEKKRTEVLREECQEFPLRLTQAD